MPNHRQDTRTIRLLKGGAVDFTSSNSMTAEDKNNRYEFVVPPHHKNNEKSSRRKPPSPHPSNSQKGPSCWKLSWMIIMNDHHERVWLCWELSSSTIIINHHHQWPSPIIILNDAQNRWRRCEYDSSPMIIIINDHHHQWCSEQMESLRVWLLSRPGTFLAVTKGDRWDRTMLLV